MHLVIVSEAGERQFEYTKYRDCDLKRLTFLV